MSLKSFRFSLSCLRNSSLSVAFLLLVTSVALAQQAATPGTPTKNDQPSTSTALTKSMILKNVLVTSYRGNDPIVLADSTVAFERIPLSVVGGLSSQTKSNGAALTEAETEKELTILVRSLPAGSLWAKIYLPAPTADRKWKADDVASLTYAQVRLFGNIGAPSTDGSIEIMGKRVSKEAAPAYIAGLNLKPVYLITNPKRQVTSLPWSTASQEQWATMTKDERKQYGQEQAAAIMALPPDERDKIIEQMRQHDKFFDTVKDPLEKLVGHDL